MTTEELKSDLIKAIGKIHNPLVLMEMRKLAIMSETDDSNVYHLDDSQKEELKLAERQIKYGEYLTEDEAQRQSDRWHED